MILLHSSPNRIYRSTACVNRRPGEGERSVRAIIDEKSPQREATQFEAAGTSLRSEPSAGNFSSVDGEEAGAGSRGTRT